MKRALLLLTGLFFFVFTNAQDKNVLFVGNSYTDSNDLPFVLNQLAGSLGNVLSYDSSTPGGYTLESHTTNMQTLEKIEQGNWDHVVFQEQSQLPALQDDVVETNVFPYAQDLADYTRAQNECSMPIFFMTWGREDGDSDNCADWPPVCTYEGMQDLLSQRYRQMAIDNECWTSPVGEAWRTARDLSDDSIDLYAPDGSHPSEAGTYLAACVFYAAIWGESPEGASYIGNLSEDDAEFLQEVAGSTVLDTPDLWNLIPLVWAELDVQPGLPFYTVTMDASYWTDSVLVETTDFTATWVDGSVSSIDLDDGWTVFEMTIYSPCGDVNIVDSVFVGDVSISELDLERYSIYPNPTRDVLYLEGFDGQWDFTLYDQHGRIVKETSIQSTSQSVKLDAAPGQYIIALQNEKERKYFRILVE